MGKAIRLKNNLYLDTAGGIHNSKNLKSYLNDPKYVTIWTGDVTPTAVNENVYVDIENASNRPYNFSVCFARVKIDSENILIPFTGWTYAQSVYYTGYWGIDNTKYAYLWLAYGGYGRIYFQVKSIAGKTLDRVHLVEIFGIK